MNERNRTSMIAAINDVADRADCREVVILQRRSRSGMIIAIAAAVAVVLVLQLLGLPPFWASVAAGVVAGPLTVFYTTNFLLGACGDPDSDDPASGSTVILASSRRTRIAGIAILHQWSPPVPVEVTGGFVSHRVTVAGEDYLVGRALKARLFDITG